MGTNAKSKLFDMIITVFTAVLVILCIAPILHVASVSLSSNVAILSRKVYIWPVGLNFEAYKNVLTDKSMIRSLFYTMGLTVLCAVLSMLMTIMAAYPLTKKNLKGRRAFMILIIITMYFNGGLIPDYLLVRNLGLYDKIWALVLPSVLSAFNLILLKSFFSRLPESLMESAHLDGASHMTILIKIVLPLSTPVLATLSLFYAVGRWNGFQDALLYIQNTRLYPIQLKLYQIVYNNQMSEIAQMEGTTTLIIPPESLKGACVMFATIPILLVYPRLQKYFVSGVTLGAIKG